MTSCQDFLQASRNRVNQALIDSLSQLNSPFLEQACNDINLLMEAVDYSLQNGGKRLRPALVYATASLMPTPISDQDQDLIACAIECIHSYSLVHDDLPAMDDDSLRRGKPTCHIAYNEATAILVGDGLQSLAFELLTRLESVEPGKAIELIRYLAQASGCMGMVGGQHIDLAMTDSIASIEQLEQLHRLKTGAMIQASIALPAIASGVNKETLQDLEDFAKAIGLAFQVQDDIIDIESDTETLGKTQGADIEQGKITYPALLGMDGAKQKARQLIDEARNSLEKQKLETSILMEIASFIISRNH